MLQANRMIAVLLALSLAGVAQADSLESAGLAWCERVKQCTLSTWADTADQVPPDMRSMIEAQVQAMCESARENLEDAESAEAGQANAAARCLRSMAEQTCDEIESGGETAACSNYRERYEQ